MQRDDQKDTAKVRRQQVRAMFPGVWVSMMKRRGIVSGPLPTRLWRVSFTSLASSLLFLKFSAADHHRPKGQGNNPDDIRLRSSFAHPGQSISSLRLGEFAYALLGLRPGSQLALNLSHDVMHRFHEMLGFWETQVCTANIQPAYLTVSHSISPNHTKTTNTTFQAQSV